MGYEIPASNIKSGLVFYLPGKIKVKATADAKKTCTCRNKQKGKLCISTSKGKYHLRGDELVVMVKL